MNFKTILGAAASVSLLAAMPATADTIVDTGQPTITGGPILDNSQWFASDFLVTTPVHITDVSLWVGSLAQFDPADFSKGGTFHILILAGNLSDVPLYSAQVSVPTTGNLPDVDWYGVHGVDWYLGVPTDYYLSAQVLPGDTFSGYAPNRAPNPLGNEDVRHPPQGWESVNDLDIGWQAFGFTGQGGAVPEPATWALMISGFGLVGATLRRRPSLA